MTIPKHARLADAAHYPIRRKGEKRRLLPNQAGIEWLEGESFESDTEIVEIGGDHVGPGLQSQYSRGWGARAWNRPMFQVFSITASSTVHVYEYETRCPACYDFAYSWACPDHSERPWNEDIRNFERPSRSEAVAPVRDLDAVDRLITSYAASFIYRVADREMRRDFFLNPVESGPIEIEVNGETIQSAGGFRLEVEQGERFRLTFNSE